MAAPGAQVRLEAHHHVIEQGHRLQACRSGDKPLGIQRWRWHLYNRLQQQVLDLEATGLFQLD